MKTLVVYASKYGFAEDCVQTLAAQMEGEAVLVNIEKQKAPDLDGFDTAVIGGSVYMGKVQKQVVEFCRENLAKLLGKRVALFLCGGRAENFDGNMKNNYPAPLLKKAVSKEYWGGEFRKDRMSLAHKLVTTALENTSRKNNTPLPEARPENIAKTAYALATV